MPADIQLRHPLGRSLSRVSPARSPSAGVGNDAFQRLAACMGAQRAPCVATFGTFDGVHRGHRALLARSREWADDLEIDLTAVTLSPRPEWLFGPRGALPDLCSVEERVRRLEAAGADRVVVLPFDSEVAALGPEQMVTLLRDVLGAVALMVGSDFALGAGRAGTPQQIRALGLRVRCAPLTPSLVVPGAKASSSHLRRLGLPAESDGVALADA